MARFVPLGLFGLGLGVGGLIGFPARLGIHIPAGRFARDLRAGGRQLLGEGGLDAGRRFAGGDPGIGLGDQRIHLGRMHGIGRRGGASGCGQQQCTRSNQSR